MDSKSVIDFIEQLRTERKISIGDFTEGVVSKRNYSRYLSKEADIPFEVLDGFLTKLDMPLFEFGNYALNDTIYKNTEEYYFYDAILSENYEYAYKELYPKIKGKVCKTIYASKTIPMGIELMLYKMNKITKYEALDAMKKSLQLNTILNSNMIFANDITALQVFLRVCDGKTTELIADHLYKVIFMKKYHILTNTVEATNIILYLITIKALTTIESTKKNKKRLKEVLDVFLEYHKRAKTSQYDIMVFENLYDYIKKNGIQNDLLVFHYYLSLLSSIDSISTKDGVKIKDIKDIDIVMSYLDDDDFLREEMYERLMKYEII